MTDQLHQLEEAADGARPPSEDDIAALFDRSPVGHISTRADGTITMVNATFVALTGHDRSELVGRRTFAGLLSGGCRIYHETHFLPILLATDRVREIALELVTADGGRLPVLVTAVLERDSSGAPAMIRIALFDATDRREYERELLRARARAEESEARARQLVRTLQQTLIPPAVPTVAGLDVTATYRPAGDGGEVGGDFYDIFEIGPDDWVIAVGDVTGKGVDAAVLTAIARSTIRAAAIRTPDPRQILGTLNAVLRRDEADRYCTVAIARLTRLSGTWRVTTGHGGHPITLLVRPTEPVSELGRPGTILGAMDEPVFTLATATLATGEAIVLYTDGVTDGRRAGHGFFGEERTRASIEGHRGSANGLTYGLLDDVLEFQSANTSDDIVIVSVQVRHQEEAE